MKKIPVRRIAEKPKLTAPSQLFKIRKVEEILAGNDLKQDLHRHDFFFVLQLKNGIGNHEIDFTPYLVHDHSVFFLRPGQVHRLELNAICTGYLMEFSSGFYYPKDKSSGQRLRKASNKNYCKLEVNRFEKLRDILSLIFREYSDRDEGYLDIIKASLEIFFIEFVRQSPNPNSVPATTGSYSQERFEEFSEHLEKHVTTHKLVSYYTGLMNLSSNQLNEITKAAVGKTSSELINEHIILEARRHLLATCNQVKDIAGYLGYEDVSYFIRFFKKHTGYSPEAFRQKQHKNQ